MQKVSDVLHLGLAGSYVVTAGKCGDTVILPICAGGDDVDHDHALVCCSLCCIAESVGIYGLKQDCLVAFGSALLDLADLLCSVLVSAEDGEFDTKLCSLGFCCLGDSDLECVGLVLLNQGDLVAACSCISFGSSCAGAGCCCVVACGIGAARRRGAAAACEQACRQDTGHQDGHQSLFHILSSLVE